MPSTEGVRSNLRWCWASFPDSTSAISIPGTEIVKDPGCNVICSKYRQQSEWMYGCVCLYVWWGFELRSLQLCGYAMKKSGFSSLTHTHTQKYKYSSTIFVKAGDKHRVFPHRPWLPFLSTEWKLRGSLKKECERRKIIDLSVTVCLCHENQPTT